MHKNNKNIATKNVPLNLSFSAGSITLKNSILEPEIYSEKKKKEKIKSIKYNKSFPSYQSKIPVVYNIIDDINNS